jgi:hypothetical protein
MKKIFITILLVVSSFMGFTQNIILSSEESLKKFLDDKQFVVGEYGTVTFHYSSYDKTFGKMEFNVEYLIPGEKKPRKILLKADIMLKLNDFMFPSFVRSISLSNPNSFLLLNLNLPTNFELFENGDLYYQDKLTMTMTDYLNARKSGSFSITAPPYKLCE